MLYGGLLNGVSFHFRLADFGSAVDDVTLAPLHGLYPRGPSTAEETAGYQPPEARDMGRYGEMWGDVGRCGEMWGDRRPL